MDHVQTKSEIRTILDSAGLHPRKRFGQHFLIDGNLMRSLVRVADLRETDLVIEIGPGTGGLTDLLVSRVGRLVLMEIDRDLAALLTTRYAEHKHVSILCGDVLESKHRIAGALAAFLMPEDAGEPQDIKLVANLPYQIATPLVLNLLVGFPRVSRLCFTVQAEVGERMVSPPGRKSYGPLAVVAQCLADIRIVTRVPASAFWPQPTIESVMIRMDRKPPPTPVADSPAAFGKFVRLIFEHRRKTLRSALRLALQNMHRDEDTQPTQKEGSRTAQGPDQNRIERATDRAGAAFDLNRRPESLTVAEWVELFQTTR